MGIGDWGLGIGDWGLGFLGQTPKPQTPQPPIPNPQSPFFFVVIFKIMEFILNKNNNF